MKASSSLVGFVLIAALLIVSCMDNGGANAITRVPIVGTVVLGKGSKGLPANASASSYVMLTGGPPQVTWSSSSVYKVGDSYTTQLPDGTLLSTIVNAADNFSGSTSDGTYAFTVVGNTYTAQAFYNGSVVFTTTMDIDARAGSIAPNGLSCVFNFVTKTSTDFYAVRIDESSNPAQITHYDFIFEKSGTWGQVRYNDLFASGLCYSQWIIWDDNFSDPINGHWNPNAQIPAEILSW